MRRTTVAMLLVLLTPLAEALADPVIGEPAPPVELEAVLQADDGAEATLEALEGHVVVLEFWATWCAPCVAAIPHMNELVAEFADRPVRFISITDEDAPTVEAFLERRPIDAWVGLDTDQSVFDAYGISGIPATAIIGPDGRLLAMTRPSLLEAMHIETALRGEALDLPTLPTGRFRSPSMYTPGGDPDDPEDLPEFLFRLTIRPSTNTEMGAESRFSGEGTGEGRLTSIDASLRHLIGRSFGIPGERVVGHDGLLSQRVTVAIETPEEAAAELYPLLRSALEATYAFTVREEMRPGRVIIIGPPSNATKQLRPSVMEVGGSLRTTGNSINAMNLSLDRLATTISESFLPETPVINETGLDGGFDFTIEWSSDEPREEAILHALREQLGLTIRLEQRPVRHIVVEPK